MSTKNILAMAMATSAVASASKHSMVGIESYFDGMDLADEANELDSLADAIDTTEQSIAGLESISDFVAATQENGGMDAQTASLVAVSVNNVMAPFGVSAGITAGNEDFDKEGGRVAATGVALESISDTLKTLWAAVVKFVKDMVKKIKLWVNKHFSTMKRLGNAAKSLGEKASENEGMPKESKIPATKVHMYSDKSTFICDVKGSGSLASLAADAAVVISEVNDNTEKYISNVVDNIELLAKKSTASDVTIVATTLGDDFKAAFKSAAVKETNDKAFTQDGKIAYTKDMSLPGGGKAVLYIDANASTDADKFLSWSRKYSGTVLKAEDFADMEQPALDTAGIEDVCSNITDAAKEMDKIGVLIIKGAGSTDKATKDVDKLLKVDADAFDSPEAKRMYKKLITTARNVINSSITIPTKAVTDLSKGLTSTYAFAKASYSNLETK